MGGAEAGGAGGGLIGLLAPLVIFAIGVAFSAFIHKFAALLVVKRDLPYLRLLAINAAAVVCIFIVIMVPLVLMDLSFNPILAFIIGWMVICGLLYKFGKTKDGQGKLDLKQAFIVGAIGAVISLGLQYLVQNFWLMAPPS